MVMADKEVEKVQSEVSKQMSEVKKLAGNNQNSNFNL
jgi:hypothetical protein